MVVGLVAFTVFGIEEIGLEIENPFGHDPNDLPLAVLDEWDPRRIAAVEKAKADGVELPQLSSYAGFTGASKTGPAKKFYK